jgi:hypothetical protein
MKQTIALATIATMLSLAAPAADAASFLPAQARTITYSAAFVGSNVRPIVGEYLDGTMRLTLYPSGIIQGLYFPQDEAPFTVSGGLDNNGKVWLLLGHSTVTGTWESGDVIDAYSTGPAYQNLKFTATPTTPKI